MEISVVPQSKRPPHEETQNIYRSPLHEMSQTTPTCFWSYSASAHELKYSLEHGAVGATCNPVLVAGMLKKELADWRPQILSLSKANRTATEDQIAWALVREISANSALLLR